MQILVGVGRHSIQYGGVGDDGYISRGDVIVITIFTTVSAADLIVVM